MPTPGFGDFEELIDASGAGLATEWFGPTCADPVIRYEKKFCNLRLLSHKNGIARDELGSKWSLLLQNT